MKKIIKAILAVAVAVLALSCNKENEQLTIHGNNDMINVCIDGTIDEYIPEDKTKASTEIVVRVKWIGDEIVYVYDGVTLIGTLKASIEGTDGTYAKLSGTIKAPSGNKVITLVYSPQFEQQAPTITNNKISLDLSMQSENDIPFLIYSVVPSLEDATVADNQKLISNYIAKFSFATSVYKCNCADLCNGEFTQVVIGKTNNVCELTLSNDDVPEIGGTVSGEGTITRTNGFTTSNSDQRAIFSVALAKAGSENKRTIEVTKGDNIYEAAFDKGNFGSGKSYNAVFMFKMACPADGLRGKFSIAEGKQVFFSKGNLYYDGNDGTFKFEEDQLSTQPKSDGNWKSDHISHFFWCNDATKAIAQTYDDACQGEAYYFADHNFTVGNTSTWRTLSNSEFSFLLGYKEFLDHRNVDKRFAKATINSVTGLLIFPDDFEWNASTMGTEPTYNSSKGGYTSNSYNITQFTAMQNVGVVFLPAAGKRNNSTNVNSFGNTGIYCSTTSRGHTQMYTILFDSEEAGSIAENRSTGCSVRLVLDFN